jgi:hypothetical protein
VCLYAGNPSVPSTTATTVASTPAYSDSRSPARSVTQEAATWGDSSQVVHPANSPFNLSRLAAQSPDHERIQAEAASGLLHLNSAGVFEDDPEAFLENAETAYSISARRESAGEPLYSAETPPDAAFSRWFGLLVKDADYEGASFPVIVNNLPEPRPQSSASGQLLCVAPSELHEERSLNRETRRAWIEKQLNSDGSYGVTPVPRQNRTLSRQFWRGSEPTKLLPHEQQLFQNFIVNVAPWVCHCYQTELIEF